MYDSRTNLSLQVVENVKSHLNEKGIYYSNSKKYKAGRRRPATECLLICMIRNPQARKHTCCWRMKLSPRKHEQCADISLSAAESLLAETFNLMEENNKWRKSMAKAARGLGKGLDSLIPAAAPKENPVKNGQQKMKTVYRRRWLKSQK